MGSTSHKTEKSTLACQKVRRQLYQQLVYLTHCCMYATCHRTQLAVGQTLVWAAPIAACVNGVHMHLTLPGALAGSTGGGSAGRSRAGGPDFAFQRQLPKFLQPYAHMLGQKKQDEDEPQVLMEQRLRAEQEDEDEEDEAAEEAGAQEHARRWQCGGSWLIQGHSSQHGSCTVSQ